MDSTWQVWLAPLQDAGLEVYRFAPKLLAALLVLITGLILAWFLKVLTSKICRWLRLDAKLSNVWLFRLWSHSMHDQKPSETTASFNYYLVLFVTILLAVKILGVTAGETILNSLLAMVPQVFSFILILFMGFLMAMFLSVLAQLALASSGIQHPNFWGKIIAWGTFGVAAMFSLQQLGMVGKFVTTLVLIFLGTLGAASAIAFGLGCKDLAREFLIELLKDDKPLTKD